MIMRIVLILGLFMVAMSCSQPLRIVWTYPLDELPADSIVFNVYAWQGDSADIVIYDDIQLDSLGQIRYVPNHGDYEYQYDFNPNSVIRAAINAEDCLGRLSDYGYTRFYGLPDRPENLRIIK